jgi:hypothetical protein
MRALATTVVLLGVVLSLPAAARAGKVKPPKLGPIVAVFKGADFATYYTVDVAPADGRKTHPVVWHLSPPKADPNCRKFRQSASNDERAVWNHGDEDGCDHTKMGARGHPGTVTAQLLDGVFHCTESYDGSISGTGDAAKCVNYAIGDAEERVSTALGNEEDAIKAIGEGKPDSFWEGNITLARAQLKFGRGRAVAGGASEEITKLIDEAIDKDAAALKTTGKKSAADLEDAATLKRKALKLLRAMPTRSP